MGDFRLEDKLDDVEPIGRFIGAVVLETADCLLWLKDEFLNWNGIIELVVIVALVLVISKYRPLITHRAAIKEQTAKKFSEKIGDQRSTAMVKGANDAVMIIRQCVILAVGCGVLGVVIASR